MNDKQFMEIYCSACGTQRCEGIHSEWFKGCKYRWNHDRYDATAEIERLNKKIISLSCNDCCNSSPILSCSICQAKLSEEKEKELIEAIKEKN